MTKRRPWTNEEEDRLRELYRDCDISVYDIADELNRTVNAITSRAYRLGIKKNPIGNYNFNDSYPPKILYRSGECFGIEFTVKCIDRCDRWLECLDLWIENIIENYLTQPKPIIGDDAGYWPSE